MTKTTSASTRKRRRKPVAKHRTVPGAVKERLAEIVAAAGTRNIRDALDPRAPALSAELRKLGYEVDEAKGQRAVNFIERRCRHTKAPYYGCPFVLYPFQFVIVFTFFACVRGDGTRWFLRLWFEVAKKNGKTELIAAILLYCLFGLNEYGGEIYSAAAAKKQAGQTYKVMVSMVKQDAVLRKRAKWSDSTKTILHPQIEAFYEVMSADADYNDGVNPSAVGVDEVHRHRSRNLYDVLAQGQGTRTEPVFMAITTAGSGQEGLAWDEHEHARHVIEGLAEDEDLLAFIYSVPVDADWQDESVWPLANPALGEFLRPDDLRSSVAKAKTSATEEHSVRRLRLNQWVSSETKWIDMPTWDRCGGLINEENLKGRAFYGGLDLSHTQDFTAWALLFPWDDDGEGFGADVLWRVWIPEKAVVTRERMGPQIEAWAKAGFVTITSGDLIDHRDVQAQVFADCEKFRNTEIGYDNFHSYPVISEFIEQGLELADVSQGYRGMNAPAKYLESLLSLKRLNHGGNPVARWMISNAVAEYDRDDHVRPSRTKSADKIDGVMAMLSALERSMANADDATSFYIPGEDTGTDG